MPHVLSRYVASTVWPHRAALTQNCSTALPFFPAITRHEFTRKLTHQLTFSRSHPAPEYGANPGIVVLIPPTEADHEDRSNALHKDGFGSIGR